MEVDEQLNTLVNPEHASNVANMVTGQGKLLLLEEATEN